MDERTDALNGAKEGGRESAALLQIFAASTSELIFAKDREGRILMVNPAVLRVLGLSREEVLGRNDIVLFGEADDAARIRQGDQQVIETGEPITLEQSRSSAAGLQTFLVTKSPLRDEHGEILGVVGVATDITEHKRAQRELEHLLITEHRLRGQAEQASRAKDEFLAIVSHELRSPLNALKGWSHLLSGTPHPDPILVTRAAQAIRRNVEHQTRLIDDLLDTSRIICGKLVLERRPVNLVEVVHSAIDLARPSALAKNVDLRFCSDHPVVSAEGDAGRLQQVVLNLLSNGIKFTPEGGAVEIDLRRIGERIELSVSDTGVGIEAEFLPHVFDRFSQADSSTTRRYRGLGVGLALVRHLVELHGGTVRAASPGPERGTTFSVELPATLGATPGARAPASPSWAQRGDALAGILVLVVDDEPDARDVTELILSGVGAQVQSFACGGDLLASLREAPPLTPPAVLLLDIAMPGEDGFSVLAKLRALEARPFLPAIALTALTHLDRGQFAAAGFQDCLAKPIDPARLIEAVAAAVGRGAP
jgi:PAS domain S-box-containing protein